jgi:hypothetical protein
MRPASGWRSSAVAHHEATVIAQLSGGSGSGSSQAIPHFVQVDFASATQTVLYVMAGIMGLAALVALRGLPRHAAVPATTAPVPVGSD